MIAGRPSAAYPVDVLRGVTLLAQGGVPLLHTV